MEKDNVTSNSGANKKSTLIYTNNQLKQTNQQLLKNNKICPVVTTTLPKNAKIVYSPASNKINRDLQKTTTVTGPQKNNATFVAARLVTHKVPVTFSVQQQQQTTTTMTTVSGQSVVTQSVGNLNQPALTQMANKTQQTPIIQSTIGQQKIISPSTIKTITTVSNIHRMPTKSPIPNNGQRTEVPTAPVNNQVMIQKDGAVTRVQLGKVQLNSNIIQTVPVSINQVLTTAHVQQRVNPTIVQQKDTAVNQKQIIQDSLKPGNASKIQVAGNIPIVQQKNIMPQKTLTVQGHQQLQQIGSMQKIPVAGIQKISIQNQQIINNSQAIDGQQQTLKLHVKNSEIDKSVTESKAPSTVTINTGQPVPTTHQVTLQQLTPQFVQIQQSSSPLQTTRLHGNTTLTTLSTNQKVSNITNPKNQQQQLVFKLNPAKNTGEGVQINVKPAVQKSGNVVKDLQGEQVQQQNANKRSIENVQLVELGQKSGVSPKKRQKQAMKKSVLPAGKVAAESWETGTTAIPSVSAGLSNSTNVVTDKVSSDETSVIKQSSKEATTRPVTEGETGNYSVVKNPQETLNNEVLRQTLNNSIAKQNQKQQQLIRKSIEGLSTSDDCFSNMNPLEALAVTSAAVIANQSIDTTDNSSIGQLSQETTSCIKTSLNTNMSALETLAVVTSAVNANTQAFDSIDYQADSCKQKGRNKKQTIVNNDKKITTPTRKVNFQQNLNFSSQMSALCEAANVQALESGYQSSSSSPDTKIKGRKKQTKVNNWDNSSSSRRVNANKMKTNLLGVNKNSVKSHVVTSVTTTNAKINEQMMNNIVSRERQQLQQKYNNTMVHDNSLRGVKKPMGIKTSLNTDMNPLKTLAVAAVAELTPKTNIKTILPHQKNPPTMMSPRNQTNKIQQQQYLVSPQFSHQQQVKNSSSVRCKPHIPVTLSPETCRDIDRMLYPDETDAEREIKKEIKTEFSSSPRPLLPHECLQFILEDHNYGAPPPLTPPPQATLPSPSKQQQQQQAVNGANTLSHPHQNFIYNPGVINLNLMSGNIADDAASAISSDGEREVEPEGEETETAPEGEGDDVEDRDDYNERNERNDADDENSVTRCICEYEHDDGYMICCDQCSVWQHVDCMGIDRSNIPDNYSCEKCLPRRVDRQRARSLQHRKREELLTSDTSSDASSTNSADTDAGTNTRPIPPTTAAGVNRKRAGLQQQQAAIPRRKSDPASHRRLNNNNNTNNNNNINENIGNTVVNNNNYPNTLNKNSRQGSNAGAASRKKETTKRAAAGASGPQVKRRNKRGVSLNSRGGGGDDDNQDMPLRQWIEGYEEAVTNHYSPELRSRIASIKGNGAFNDIKQQNNINMNALANGKCRVNLHDNNIIKYLVSTIFLQPNTPIIELRGKFMLSAQHRTSYQGRQHSQRGPGPFVFFHRLSRDNTEICVDTRTYGNDARFVRRSCTPNAEIRHCVEKGALHFYIVSINSIDKNTEITIRHEQHDLLTPNYINTNSLMSYYTCACGDSRTCKISSIVANQVGTSRRTSNNNNNTVTTATTTTAGGVGTTTTNGNLNDNDGRERRRRGRRSAVNNDDINNSSPAGPSTKAQVNNPTLAITTKIPPVTSSDTSVTTTGVVTRKLRDDKVKDEKNKINIETTTTTSVQNSLSSKEAIESLTSSVPIAAVIKKEPTAAATLPSSPPVTTVTSSSSTTNVTGLTKKRTTASSRNSSRVSQEIEKKEEPKKTREERKIDNVIKIIDNLSKADEKKKQGRLRNKQRKESGGDDGNVQIPHHLTRKQLVNNNKKQNNIEKPIRRRRRKGRARTSSTSNTQARNRRTRTSSIESDLSSNDDDDNIPTRRRQLQSSSSQQQQQSSYHRNINLSSSSSSSSALQNDINTNSSTAAGLLLALASGGDNSPSSSSFQQQLQSKSPTCDSGASSSSSQSSTPSAQLSSACLLVAAAVGPLAPDFKFPKTKKVLMNEWLRESPDPQQITSQNTVMTASMLSPNLKANNFMDSNTNASDYLSNQQQNYGGIIGGGGAKGLETLVQAANSVSGICEQQSSPPLQKNKQTNAPLFSTMQGQVSSGSAKKRWLRQAISEECDSPNSRPDSPPCEIVAAAPPKKRRIARESLSSDNYTPPTTPTHLQNDNNNFVNPSGNYSAIYSGIDNDFADRSRVVSPSSTPQTSSLTDIQLEEREMEIKKSEFYRNFDLINCNEITSKLSVIKTCQSSVNQVEKIEEYCEDDKKNVNLDLTDRVEVKVETIKSEIDATKSEINQEFKDELVKQDDFNSDTEEICNIKTEKKCKFDDIVSDDIKCESEIDESSIINDKTKCEKIEFDASSNNTSQSEIGNSNDKQESIGPVGAGINEQISSIDEFDVEAQMKKITGDDGNDFIYTKDKIQITLESKDSKSFDGIEGLMESSKEDSGSEEKDEDKKINEPRHFENFNNQKKEEERAFKEIEKMSNLNVEVFIKDGAACIIDNKKYDQSAPTSTTCSVSEESMFDSVSNLDCEGTIDPPPEIFQSIPPLSERIRKKSGKSSSASKRNIDFVEASIIESTIDMDSIEVENGELNKTELSAALRQLLETKIDQVSTEGLVNEPEPLSVNQPAPEFEPLSVNQPAPELEPLPVNQPPPEDDCHSLLNENPVLTTVTTTTTTATPQLASTNQSSLPPPFTSQPQQQQQQQQQSQTQPQINTEVKRDPRKAVPYERPASEAPAPIKRKVRTLSISEYRKRKQQSTGVASEAEPSNDNSPDKSPDRGRSDSASSETSPLSSDDENTSKTINIDKQDSIPTLPLFSTTENEERKGGVEEGKIGWSAAPTLVERQRENLTERLKREFGLFLSDDEEERARKQGLTAEAILKARLSTSEYSALTSQSSFPSSQLPPQPYIPPPGSASINYPHLTGQNYQNFSSTQQSTSSLIYPATGPVTVSKITTGEFLVPQAPPGSNPYPPSQFVAGTSGATVEPPPVDLIDSSQVQNSYYTNPPPRT